MSSRWLGLLILGLVACHGGKSPELRVLGVHEAARRGVVFGQGTNPGSRPMRLTKLEYVFAAGDEKLAQGELPLSSDVPAGSAVVVEVPLTGAPEQMPVTLRGKLTA